MRLIVKIMYCVVGFMFSVISFGCASIPANIAPVDVSETKYIGLDCPQLKLQQNEMTKELTMYSIAQEQTRTSDAVGVFMIGLPLGSIAGGNKAPEIAMLKGEISAIHRVAEGKGCGIAFPRVAEYNKPKNTSLSNEEPACCGSVND